MRHESSLLAMGEYRRGRGQALVESGLLGSRLVESALVALVFLATLIGIFDLGQILFVHQAFVERARSAARYAAVNTFDEAAFKNMVLYHQTTVPEGRTSGIFGLTPAQVSVTQHDVNTNDHRIVVAINDYPCRFLSPLIARVFTGRSITISLPSEQP
jgi:Flp pilus assembly protein TadG